MLPKGTSESEHGPVAAPAGEAREALVRERAVPPGRDDRVNGVMDDSIAHGGGGDDAPLWVNDPDQPIRTTRFAEASSVTRRLTIRSAFPLCARWIVTIQAAQPTSDLTADLVQMT